MGPRDKTRVIITLVPGYFCSYHGAYSARGRNKSSQGRALPWDTERMVTQEQTKPLVIDVK